MYSRSTISYREAIAYVEGALRRASADHGPTAAIACAVVGSAGELVAFGAQDGTGVLPRRLASRKAYSAVLFKRDTASVKEAVDSGAILLSRLADDDLLAIPGGVPIVVDGEIIGAIGVSGLTPQQDAEIATALSIGIQA